MSKLEDIIARDAAGNGSAALNAIIAREAASPAPAQPAEPAANQAAWKTPSAMTMGVGDIVRGGVQNLVHGMSWVADRVAPDSQFAQDARAALPQIAETVGAQNQQYAQDRQAKGKSGIDLGRVAGNILATAPAAALMPVGTGLAGTTAAGAASGALSNLMMPADSSAPYIDQKLDQAKTGAITGAVAAPVTKAIGAMIGGAAGEAQKRLADAGVTMTPGQILGGAWARTEEKLSSIPVVGDLIKNAQQRSVQSFNKATYDDALKPIGGAIPKDMEAGSDAVGYVRGAIGKVYDSLVPRARFANDANFVSDVAGVRANLAQTAPAMLQQFDNIVENQVTKKLQNGVLSGEQWNNSRSTIAQIARDQVLGNATPDNRALSGALNELTTALNAGVGRSSPSDILPSLANANSAWARYKQIEGAAGSAGASNNGNVFTAAQYANAVRKGETAAQRAQNSGMNADLAVAGQQVLGGKYPDSGTPGRAALMGVLGALTGGGAVASGYGIPLVVGTGVASIPYTSVGQRIGQSLLMDRPAFALPVKDALTRYGVPLAPALGTALLNGIQPSQ